MEWLVGIAGIWLFFQFVVPILLVGLAVYVAYRYMKSRWPEGRPVPYEAPPEQMGPVETRASSARPLTPDDDRLIRGELAPARGRDVHLVQPHEAHESVHVFRAHEEHPEVHILPPREPHPEAHIIREDERR